MSKIFKVSEIAVLNKETYKKNKLPSNLKYLDTGSLTKNKISEYQSLNINIDKIPSRAQRKVALNTILYSTVRPNQEHFGIVENLIDGLIVSTGFTTIDIIDDKINSKYLYYKLTQKYITEYLHTIGMNSVSAYPSISPNDIGGLKFEFPNLQTQKAIAKVLSDLDTKIEVNNKINQELEAMAKTIYDYWFVQFDFPNEQGKPYKTSGGKMVYNEELKREIPEGWEVKELGDISEIKRGKLVTAKTADLEGEIKVVSAGIDYSYFHSESNRLENTITISGSGANAGFVNFWREPIFANDCSTVRGKTDSETLIILEFLRMRQNYIFKQARGSAQPHVYPKDISVLKITIPNNDLFNDFGKLILPSNKKTANNLKQNQKLSQLQDWLLPMLMNEI
ncbi:MAG TPA: restriction endonuclease subunit S, partial [Saprospiraceae bacterium]|nr:restriction endonuclease subunit S [Saprospiraceae bacterium]